MIGLGVAENIFFVLMVVFILPYIVCHLGFEAASRFWSDDEKDNQCEGTIMDFFYVFPGTLIIGPLLTLTWIAGICILIVKIVHVLKHF